MTLGIDYGEVILWFGAYLIFETPRRVLGFELDVQIRSTQTVADKQYHRCAIIIPKVVDLASPQIMRKESFFPIRAMLQI